MSEVQNSQCPIFLPWMGALLFQCIVLRENHNRPNLTASIVNPAHITHGRSFDMTATFSREETSQTFNSLSYEQMAMENDLMSRPILTSQTPSTASFAIQPEDFPALPGTHLHENLIINESDASTLQRAPVEGLQSVKLPRVAHSDFQPLRPPTNPLDDKTAAHSVPGHISKVQVDLAKQAASVRNDDYASTISLDCDSAGIINAMPSGCTSNVGDIVSPKQQKFGLLGLLDVIRMTNADLNTLALGSDLTTLGLNLNSTECLYATFASPWAEAPTTREPQFSLPMCYYMQPPPLKTSHLSKFQLETLFYIFYAMPKDVLQAYSAQELYNRAWQYHQDLKLWFKCGSAADGLSVPSNQHVYFDIKTWECRRFSDPHAGSLQRRPKQQFFGHPLSI